MRRSRAGTPSSSRTCADGTARQGDFVPYLHEGRDGYDTIEWAAAQPWSNGAVGTFGLSYPGAVQWLAAVESPPHLKAMVPAMTFSSPRNFFYAGGAWDLSWIPWIWNNIAPDTRARRGLDGPRTGREARAAWKDLEGVLPFRMPLSNVSELRTVAPYYFDWLAHRPADPWWDWAELRGRYGRAKAAVLNVSGWHDEAYGPEGATTNFLGLLASRSGEADPRARLVIGPWVHGGIESEKSGERVFGREAKLDEAELVLSFLDRYVRGVGAASDGEPPVRAFVMGENRWRSGKTWPLPGTRPLSLYFAPGGRLSEAPPAGRGGGEPVRLRPAASRRRPARHGLRRARLSLARLPFGRPRLRDGAPAGRPARPRPRRDGDPPLLRRPGPRSLGQARGRRGRRDGLESLEPGHGRAARERAERRA